MHYFLDVATTSTAGEQQPDPAPHPQFTFFAIRHLKYCTVPTVLANMVQNGCLCVVLYMERKFKTRDIAHGPFKSDPHALLTHFSLKEQVSPCQLSSMHHSKRQ